MFWDGTGPRGAWLRQKLCNSLRQSESDANTALSRLPAMCCARGMDRSADLLPDDVDALRVLALNAVAERDAAIAARHRLVAMNERLRRMLRKA